MIRVTVAIAALLLSALMARSDPAEVEQVALEGRAGTWTVSVTISHADTGWDDYADGWRVETRDGEVLGTRVLHHPHVEEQPFTRSLGGVDISPDVTEIVIRTRTSVTGWSDDVSAPTAVPRTE